MLNKLKHKTRITQKRKKNTQVMHAQKNREKKKSDKIT